MLLSESIEELFLRTTPGPSVNSDLLLGWGEEVTLAAFARLLTPKGLAEELSRLLRLPLLLLPLLLVATARKELRSMLPPLAFVTVLPILAGFPHFAFLLRDLLLDAAL
jgi:hypothetical protein